MLPSIFLSLALFVLDAAAAVPPQRHEPLHLPVVRRHNARRGGAADMDRFAAAAHRLKGKYGYRRSALSRRAPTTTDIGITNQGQDTSYFAQVNVGTPPQSFALVLDTGSSDLWFATTGCSDCSSSTPLLDPTKSSSFQSTSQTIPLSYGSGNATGSLARDAVSVGPFTVAQQTFVNTLSSGLIDGKLSGILGLAFQGIANTRAVPFWQALIANNLLTNPEFSFFITRFINDQSAAQEEPGGVFTLGGTNSTLFQGDIDFRTFTSVGSGGSFWSQTVSGVTVNGKTVNAGNANSAAIDTGTTLIGAPTAAVTAIWSAVSGAKPLSGQFAGFWAFPCSSQFTVALSFGGPSWPISIEDMNLGTIGGGQCLGAIFDITQGSDISSQSAPSWIVGDTFLKNVYTVFRATNPPAIGFAQLSKTAGGSSGTPGPAIGTARVSGVLPTPSNAAAPARRIASFGNFGVLATGALSLLTVAFMLAAC